MYNNYSKMTISDSLLIIETLKKLNTPFTSPNVIIMLECINIARKANNTYYLINACDNRGYYCSLKDAQAVLDTYNEFGIFKSTLLLKNRLKASLRTCKEVLEDYRDNQINKE